MIMKLALLFIINLLAYTTLYITYSAAAKEMASRVVWISASLVGTLLGSTLGARWFK